MKKAIIIIASIVVVLGVIGAVITYHVQKRLYAAPEIKELTMPDTTVLAGGVYSNPVICGMSLKENREGMVACRLEGYKYLSGEMLYRAEWKIGLPNNDTLCGDTIQLYYEQRDPVVCATEASKVYVQFIPLEGQPSAGKILITCYEEDYLHELFAQPITEIGVYTANRGIVKLPMRPETSEQLAERYALILEYFAQH